MIFSHPVCPTNHSVAYAARGIGREILVSRSAGTAAPRIPTRAKNLAGIAKGTTLLAASPDFPVRI